MGFGGIRPTAVFRGGQGASLLEIAWPDRLSIQPDGAAHRPGEEAPTPLVIPKLPSWLSVRADAIGI